MRGPVLLCLSLLLAASAPAAGRQPASTPEGPSSGPQGAPSDQPSVESPPAEETLAIVTGFHEDYSQITVGEMRRELEDILDIDGLNIAWRDLSARPDKEVFDHVVVARFRGPCQVTPGVVEHSQSSALGFTHVSEGNIIPFAEIDCGRVERLIHPLTSGESVARSEALLGRALGRVLAHELYHILAETAKHAKNGIAKAVLSPQELLAGHMNFEEANLTRIRDKVLQPHFDKSAQRGQ